ncbi:MAG TPA: hypothetical protein DIT07_07180, partial [Sphingobacteriaceae bacterium]|nr:hypothetical protein [Sphingobacteriaceae bacterium]
EENRVLKLDYYLQTQSFFNKHGGKAVIFSRFLPIIRTIAPFVAGIGKMSFPRYSFYNIVGGASWIFSFLLLGYLFGNIPVIKENFTLVVIGIIILSVAPTIYALVLSKYRKRKAA